MPFLPCSFTWYIASSAAWIRPSVECATSGSVATPTDTVRWMLRPSPCRNLCALTRSRMRSPTAAAPSLPVSGRISANSSPPKRATTSVSRALWRISPAASTRARLPTPAPSTHGAAAIEVAVRVVDRLEPVEIDEQQRQRPSAARRPLGLAPHHLRQVPRVVQRPQTAGDRQRLGALHPDRVIERNRARLQHREQRRLRRRREPWLTRGRAAIQPDERPPRAAAALERKGHRRDAPPGLEPPILPDVHRRTDPPVFQDPLPDRYRGRLERRRHAARSQRPHAGVVNGVDDPRGRRQPLRRARDDGIGAALRVEARVDFANSFREGIGARQE